MANKKKCNQTLGNNTLAENLVNQQTIPFDFGKRLFLVRLNLIRKIGLNYFDRLAKAMNGGNLWRPAMKKRNAKYTYIAKIVWKLRKYTNKKAINIIRSEFCFALKKWEKKP